MQASTYRALLRHLRLHRVLIALPTRPLFTPMNWRQVQELNVIQRIIRARYSRLTQVRVK